MTPIALTIAGSDPSGGAGLQADIKTFQHFGVYGEAVVTLITAQNTVRVSRVETLAPSLVAEQVEAVLEDIPPHAAKTGALGSAEIVTTVAHLARGFRFPLIVDPVMISKHGARLMDPGAIDALIEQLIPRAYLLTPNLDEAAALTGLAVNSPETMIRAAKELIRMGAANVLVKGGHLEGDAQDILVSSAGGIHPFTSPRIVTRHTHGTGCAYSAAITAGLAKSLPLFQAIQRAKEFMDAAIRSAPSLGHGNGPLNFGVDDGPSSSGKSASLP